MRNRLFFIFLALLSFQFFAFGQQAQSYKDNDSVFKDSVPNTFENEILEQINAIKAIQDSTYQQRMRAIRERQRNDSMNHKESEGYLATDYGVMVKIEDNTRQHPMTDGWNFYGIAAFIIAVLSAAISWYTYKAQQRTEGNTKKLSQDAQRELLNELLRHLYRNYVITYTMRTKMKDIDYKGYPSEEHYEKLKIPMENIHLDAFYGEDEKFQLMHVLYLNLRNYNEEIEVALKHVTNPSIKPVTKDEDFDTLEFKVSYLTGKIYDTIVAIWGDKGELKEEYKNEMKDAMALSLEGKTNATENIDVPNSADFEHLPLSSLKKTMYSKIFSEEELAKVCTVFNSDVHEERKKNARGAWKIRMIEF